MRSDREIEQDVRDELGWDPDLDATDISVSARSGVVTLTGFVKRYSDKYEAETAAKRVIGVTAMANDIEVRLPAIDQRPDPDIALEAAGAVKSQLPLSSQNLKVVLNNGWVTLEGTAEWQYQRQAAENAVRRIAGVKGVTNSITVRPRVQPGEIKGQIQQAFRRHAEVDSNRVQVETRGSEVTLKGSVRSWTEREEAERAAWAAPGVTKVDDRLVVTP